MNRVENNNAADLKNKAEIHHHLCIERNGQVLLFFRRLVYIFVGVVAVVDLVQRKERY